jgi:hypothetical protein
MNKKFYEAPSMEEIKLSHFSALLESSGIISNPGMNPEEPDPSTIEDD